MPKALKRTLGLFVYLTTITVILGVGAILWAANEFQKPGPLTNNVLFEVKRGQGLSTISLNLEKQNAIENAQIFNIAGQVLNAHRDLKAGEYALTPGMSARHIMKRLRAGTVHQRLVTIREGLTSHEIVAIINGEDDLSGEVIETPIEGSLLPETYDYRLGEDRTEFLARLQSAMKTTVDDLWLGREDNLPIKNKAEVITLASIVEKETAVADERRRVAGVFINRLRRGIALQTDPTVIYALTQGKPKNDGKGPLGRRLLKKDLEFDSPYNTYKYPGLPPGPIANPGKASIAAVLNPEEHDYIYFVADGTGGHAFAKTLDEHNRNVAKWRKIRRASGK